jgi:hypothetical protein
MAREDFVKVRLTEHGERVAQGHAVNVASGNQYFTFHPGETRDDITRVLRLGEVLEGRPAAGRADV